jgi:hypothetical protein
MCCREEELDPAPRESVSEFPHELNVLRMQRIRLDLSPEL